MSIPKSFAGLSLSQKSSSQGAEIPHSTDRNPPLNMSGAGAS
jgi:hypothetical protein